MRKILASVFFLVALNLSAQNEVIVSLEKIDELTVNHGLEVNLIKSEEQKLEIIGSKASDIQFKNKNGELKLSIKFGKSFDEKNTAINLYYNSDIPELDANHGSKISSKDVFKQPQLEASVQEGSLIKLTVELEYLKVKGITGGVVDVKGTAKNQNLDFVSGANFNGFELETEQTTAYVSTGSNINVNVTGVLDAKAKFGGNIVFKGRPKSVSTEESIGGKVVKSPSQNK